MTAKVIQAFDLWEFSLPKSIKKRLKENCEELSWFANNKYWRLILQTDKFGL